MPLTPCSPSSPFPLSQITGLAFVHMRGIIHRDLKPANILLAPAPPAAPPDAPPFPLSAKITDFGLSTLSRGRGSSAPGTADWGGSGGSDFGSSGAEGGSGGRGTSGIGAGADRGGSGGEGSGSGNGSELGCGSGSEPHTGGVGTASYAAPEQLAPRGGSGDGGSGGGGGYSSAVDLFSAGLLLMELFCRFTTGAFVEGQLLGYAEVVGDAVSYERASS